MRNTISLDQLVGELQKLAVNHFREAVHPPKEYFAPQVLRDIRDQADLDKDLSRRVTFSEAEGILSKFNGRGTQTSVDMDSLAQRVVDSLRNPDSYLGGLLGAVKSATSTPMSKEEFIAILPEAIQQEGFEYDAFINKLPQTINGIKDAHIALNDALTSDYDGPIVDYIDDAFAKIPTKAPRHNPSTQFHA